MIRGAFNTLTRIHSRVAQLKRLGSPDLFSPCRITPSNYFRFLRGPSDTTIHGREFIIPLDTMFGQFAQLVTFEELPDSGTYELSFNGNDTTDLNFDESTANIQIALRLLPGLTNVVVSGDYVSGILIVFPGFSTEPLAITVTASSLLDVDTDPVVTTVANTFQVWAAPIIKRGDRIIDSVYGLLTIDELIEMVDLGGGILGFRCRAE